MSNPKDYTVGWVCALAVEYIAAQEFLDEEHDRPEFSSTHDHNDYTLGKIGKHNVVIAVLPKGKHGDSYVTGVAKDMLHSFPNIQFILMVGIGGGAPSAKHDIRLGDVVVSTPSPRRGGVLQYDFGKAIQGQGFQITGYLNQPPPLLLTTLNGIVTKHQGKGHQLNEAIQRILDRNPRLRQDHECPGSSSDRLYRSDVVHPAGGGICSDSCGDAPSSLVHRPERTQYDANPAIHYGLIASANQLMKDALIRDKLAKEEDVLCFEIGAAGLMDQFPCLVIRGICDYSDSHENKEWQGYAAFTAAAYAQELLYRVIPKQVEAEKRAQDVLSTLRGKFNKPI